MSCTISFLYHLLRFGSRPRKLFRMAKYAYGGRYPDDVIRHWLKTFCRRFFQQQFKRSCIPDGPKVGSVTLSPRGAGVCRRTRRAACGLRRRKRSDSPFFTPARLTSGVQRAMIVTDFHKESLLMFTSVFASYYYFTVAR